MVTASPDDEHGRMAYASAPYYGPTDRCSDVDREKIAERIRDAHVDGRLDADEFASRLDATLSARTYGDLERSVRDLEQLWR
jgi:Domain of unknown function (DUF1707)